MKKLLLVLLCLGTIANAEVATKENIAKLYLATFDRAPDAAGLKYWLNSELILEEIALSFFEQEETAEKYPKGTEDETFIHSIFLNLFQRKADAEGLAYWLEELRLEHVSRPLMILAVINGAIGSDASILKNKLTVSAKVSLGESFFNDTSFSLTRNQSCATCHNPNHAFIDDRDNGVGGAVSAGDNGFSLGDRNSPSVAYALFSPEFTNDGRYLGGQFYDGRAANLIEQAKGPFLNAVEMQMPSKSAVVDRILENPAYISEMEGLYGEDIFDNPSNAFNALADAIASYETSAEFQSFDAKFDKVRAGEVTFTAQEKQGERLFRSSSCVGCHDDRGDRAVFATYRYDNIGVPKNTEVRIANGFGLGYVDHGLFDNIDDRRQDGRFKTSSLRNVAVTGPYMHNGIFANLKTVVHFYNTRDIGGINPETGVPWEDSEVNANKVIVDGLGNLGLSDAEEDAIVAYLKTFTDERYEALIP